MYDVQRVCVQFVDTTAYSCTHTHTHASNAWVYRVLGKHFYAMARNGT